jgi:hypothetical protein
MEMDVSWTKIRRLCPQTVLTAVVPIVLYSILNCRTCLLSVWSYSRQGELLSAAITGLYLIGAGMLFLSITVLLRSWRLLIFYVICASSLMTNWIFFSIARRRIDGEMATWLLDQHGSLSNVWGEYSNHFVSVGIAVVTMLVMLLIWRSVILRRILPVVSSNRVVYLAASIVFFILLHMSCLVYYSPDILTAEVNLPLLVLANYVRAEPVPRPVWCTPSVRTGINKVVLIVDESVRADFFKESMKDSLKFFPSIDFGEAAANANCSAGSNALLRWGIDQNRIGTDNYDPRDGTPIWAYAKSAGYKTVLIDGQAGWGYPQNFLGKHESQLIDERVIIENDPETDLRIAQELVRRFQSHAREFIYIIKRGVHFPYEQSYPQGYCPVEATKIDKYRAGIRYNTNRFFAELRDGVDYSSVFAVYTSDHGQVFGEAMHTHCNYLPKWQEYSVPLVILTGSREVRERLDSAIAPAFDHASHEQIFPTLLWVMGYPEGSEGQQYAQPLFGAWHKYSVLVAYAPVPGFGKVSRHASFKVFDHFPYR